MWSHEAIIASWVACVGSDYSIVLIEVKIGHSFFVVVSYMFPCVRFGCLVSSIRTETWCFLGTLAACSFGWWTELWMHVLLNVSRVWFGVFRRFCGVLVCSSSGVVSFVEWRIAVVSLGVLFVCLLMVSHYNSVVMRGSIPLTCLQC